MGEHVKYSGSCHCGDVKFEVVALKNLQATDCNCTICTKKQNRHVIVPSANFKLLTGHTSLTTYTFNTHQAKHMFCSKCGVQCFYIPRSNSDGMGIMPHCIDSPQPNKVTVVEFDGKNWEDAIKTKTGASIQKSSKSPK